MASWCSDQPPDPADWLWKGHPWLPIISWSRAVPLASWLASVSWRRPLCSLGGPQPWTPQSTVLVRASWWIRSRPEGQRGIRRARSRGVLRLGDDLGRRWHRISEVEHYLPRTDYLWPATYATRNHWRHHAQSLWIYRRENWTCQPNWPVGLFLLLTNQPPDHLHLFATLLSYLLLLLGNRLPGWTVLFANSGLALRYFTNMSKDCYVSASIHAQSIFVFQNALWPQSCAASSLKSIK